MAIDDPKEAFEQQWMKEEHNLPGKLAKTGWDIGSKLALPDRGLAVEILGKVIEVLFNRDSTAERITAMWELIRTEFEHVDKTKANHEDLQRAIQLAIWYDSHERENRKRERYVKLIGHALRSETQIEDVASFIETLRQLNERDIAVLKKLNLVMNNDGDWRTHPDPSANDVLKVHPNTFIQRSQALAVQVAQALGQNTNTNLFSREEGFSICNRLQGFGLAHEINTESRELPVTNYCFRPSVHGLTLLKLLGEHVPNFEFYRQQK